jgi:hypothetical protein
MGECFSRALVPLHPNHIPCLFNERRKCEEVLKEQEDVCTEMEMNEAISQRGGPTL